MIDDETKLSLEIIEELQNARIGDPSRLSAIKFAIEGGRQLHESDKQYLRQKQDELRLQQNETKTQKRETSEMPYYSKGLSENDYSLMILKNRLAKGEISTEEYDKLRKKLLEGNPANGFESEIHHIADTMEKMQDKQMIAESIRSQMKSESVTLVLSILLGLFGLSGIGHMYMGKVGKGVGILILGIILVIIGAVTLAFFVGYVFFIIYLAVFIWQIIDSRKLCQEYNEYFRLHNESPW